MANPLLYTYRRCPYAMRARMALLVAGVAFDACEIQLRDMPAELLALSPKGTVPVLHLPDGSVIEESWDIMQWALSTLDRDGWWSPAQTPENLEWVARNDGVFKYHLDRYKYPLRYGKGYGVEHREKAVAEILVRLENAIAQRGYLGGIDPCATDLAIFPFVRQFAAVDPDWFARQSLPALKVWLVQWMASPLFVACMVKLPRQSITPFPTLGKPRTAATR